MHIGGAQAVFGGGVSTPGHFWSAVDGTANQAWIFDVDMADLMSLHIVTSGTLTGGTFKVFVSNSYSPGAANTQDETKAQTAGNWVDITSQCLGIVNPSGGTSDSHVVVCRSDGNAAHAIVPMVCATWVKITWTAGTGTGNIDGWNLQRGFH
jgi:hypothetical protein